MIQERNLFTFGYEGLTLPAFIEAVHVSGVETIIDVRELPLSRKRGFSKSAFSRELSAAGIEYEHMPLLGCPKPIRDNYRLDRDWDKYSRSFIAHLSEQEPAIQVLIDLSRITTACLICYEADYARCHRTYVARAAAALGGPAILHLTADAKRATPDPHHPPRAYAAQMH